MGGNLFLAYYPLNVFKYIICDGQTDFHTNQIGGEEVRIELV